MAVTGSYCIDDDVSFADREFRYTAQFRVITDDRDQAGPDVLNQATAASPQPVPAAFASYSLNGASDPNAFAQTFKCKRLKADDAACIWIVDVEWFPKEGDPDDDSTSIDDPLARPLRIDSEEEEVQEIVENGWNEEALTNLGRAADTYGPIVNAAGGPPGTPLIRPKMLTVLVFVKNFATLEEILDLQQTYVGKLNDSEFYGAPEGKAICRSIRPSAEMFAGGQSYREATFRIAADAAGFSYPMVNRGFESLIEFPTSSGDYVRFPVFKPDGSLATEPALLELDGTLTAEGDIGTTINWRVSDKVDFGGMGIGG